MIKVSVIVPVYNVEQYLSKCLNSLVSQSLEEIEIIVVNDGTKDNSQQIIDQFANKYKSKVFAFHKENGGLSSARNFGIKQAKGKYIAFVDSDDFVLPNMYEKMYEKAVSEDFDLVCCDFNELRGNEITPCFCHLTRDLKTKESIKEAMVDFYPSAWNKLYKRSILTEYSIFFKQGVWFEDVEFIYRLLPFINTIGVVNDHFYQYLIREGSITSQNDMRIYHYVENLNGLIDYYKMHNLYETYQREIEYTYVRYMYATFIKSAAKFDKQEFSKAVKIAIKNVLMNFPNYKNNVYIKEKNWKNRYLRNFSPLLAKVIYFRYHK